LWRIADEPIMALDGDTAGLRAAYRVIDLALPLIEAGKSLRFVLMPEGQDPDDLLRAQGPSAVQALVDRAMPMVDLLWQRETEGRDFDSPERKAALDKALRDKIKLIRDPGIRSHYGQAIKDMRWQLFRPQSKSGPRKGAASGRWQKQEPVRATTKSSLLAASGGAAEVQLREAVILATLIKTPEILDEFEAALDKLACSAPHHESIRDALVFHQPVGTGDLEAELSEKLGVDVVEKLLNLPHVALVPAVRRPGDVDLARMTVAETLAKLQADRGLAAEIIEAEQDMAGVADEAITWRLSEAAQARNRALMSQQEDKTEYERGENGAQMSRAERERFDALLEQIGFEKGSDR
ncbi:MAG: DNA primase, partial [Pseudomonadota bacterium]